MIESELCRLFANRSGEQVKEIAGLSAAGSNRHYFRMKGTNFKCIGVVGTSGEENKAFVYMSGHFRKKGLPVPEVYACSEDGLCYLQEDLGDILLFDRLEEARKSGIWDEKEYVVLRETIRLLPSFQFNGANGFDFDHCYPLAEFNERSIFWDLNYFKYCFLKASGLDFREDILEDDFKKMADVLLQEPSETFMYRDFQSRNVMLYDARPYFIDFQGGRKGPVYYDVASFLWQAKACYPDQLRQKLLEDYLQALSKYTEVDKRKFKDRLRHFLLFRTLQVLGAYGFRGYFEKKQYFIQSVPFAIQNLRILLQENYAEYPYLTRVLKELADLSFFEISEKKQRLEVIVYSFGYKNGIPEDRSGNGGGFVFDCRAIHNPGKYEQYRQLTGLDEPVIHFLEEDGEIVSFLKHVSQLTDDSVKCYLERGFTDLTVCFGCTGGRHRSVYSAQHLAEHIHRKFGIKVRLIHREQNIEQIFEAVK